MKKDKLTSIELKHLVNYITDKESSFLTVCIKLKNMFLANLLLELIGLSGNDSIIDFELMNKFYITIFHYVFGKCFV